MSDAFESSKIKESFVEDESKVYIEETCVNLACVKNEPNEDATDFEEFGDREQYRITLEYENIFGESSHQLKIEEDYDNLIGFRDNNVIMENAMIKLEAIKEEDDGSFNNFHCRNCKGIYKGYCLKCSTLLCILNNNMSVASFEAESNTMPTDILEIRETSRGKGVYLLRTLPTNIIFGPFEGILGIESTVGHSWKIIDNKLKNIKSGNWMKNIDCATSASMKNLDIFQIDGNLYFQTNREIVGGEELLIYYKDEELQQLDNSEEYLYTPQKQEKLAKKFACTVCCLGFGSNKCLMEHKRKCCRMEHSRTTKDFVLVECHYCKMWMEKWEHKEYHVAYCLEKHHRMWNNYSDGVDRNDANVEGMGEGDCGTRAGKRRYRRDISSRPKDRTDASQFNTKDYPCFSGAKHETCVKECTWAERFNNEQAQNAIETNTKSHLKKHRNMHKGIKLFKCDICLKEFTLKGSLNTHIKNKHARDGSTNDYKCLDCTYATNNKYYLQSHLNKHKGIKPFQCDICMKTFTVKDSLKSHIKNKHARDGSTKDYKCLECSYETNYKCSLQIHLNKHKGVKAFQCDICMMQFTQKVNLKRHIRNKHTDDGGVKDYKCSECSFGSNVKISLQRHLNKHRGIKPFKCDICMMKFIQKANLKTHIRNKHTDDGGVKDYKCLECTYATNNKYYLQTHLNKHRGGIKEFQCEICMKKFTQRSSLNAHIRNKHADDRSSKVYKCSECSYYQTTSKSNLQRHLNKHRGIRPFQCHTCMIQFTGKDELKMHIKNEHADDGSSKDYKCYVYNIII